MSQHPRWLLRVADCCYKNCPCCCFATASIKMNMTKQNGFNQYVMMTSSNGNIFRVTGPLCGEFTGPGEFPTQRPVTRSFDVYFDLRLNKRLSKQPWGWWFETPSWSLWRQRNGVLVTNWYVDCGSYWMNGLQKLSVQLSAVEYC